MLSLLGRSTAERGKSIAIVVLVSLLGASLFQISTNHSLTVGEQEDRKIVADVARQFTIALTTYDYAHVNLYLRQVASFSSPAVVQRVTAAAEDLSVNRASSLGDTTDLVITSLTSSYANALIGTSQVVSGRYVGGVTTLTGLLAVTVSRPGKDWVVTDYHWVLAPSGSP